MSTLEAINRRLSQQTFIGNPADERFFGELIGQIRGMAERHKRDIKKSLPDICEAGAWSKAWAIREAFIRLEQETKPDPVARERTLSAAANEERWNEYLRSRDQLVELIQRGREGRQMQEYIGLVEGDLDLPIDNDPETVCLSGGKKPGWQSVAYRINNALGKLQGMSDNERQTVPFVMALRRTETSILDLRKRIENIETYLASNNQPQEIAA